MTLKFYNTNIDLDRNYLEVASKYNLVYWIASDLYHYATSYQGSFNEYEYERMIKQYNLASNLMYEADDIAQFIEGDRKKCLLTQRNFTELTLIDLRIDKIFSTKLDSESEELRYLSMQDKFDDFTDQYKQYLIPESIEYSLLEAMKYYAIAERAMAKFNAQFEFNNVEKNEQLIEDIVIELISARTLLNQVINNNTYQDSLISEFLISTYQHKETVCKSSLLNYISMNKGYVELWREFFATHEEVYRGFIESLDTQDCELEFNALQIEQYVSRINQAAIELNLFILSNMDIKIPHIEIYSARAIKGPIDFLTKRNIHN
tara:strand:+ start:847 stop:1803 length:957 start_codon:yes stop_codon:yes gene_type:complete